MQRYSQVAKMKELRAIALPHYNAAMQNPVVADLITATLRLEGDSGEVTSELEEAYKLNNVLIGKIPNEQLWAICIICSWDGWEEAYSHLNAESFNHESLK